MWAAAPGMPCVDSGTTGVCSQFKKNVNVTTSWAPYTVLFNETLQDGGIMGYKPQAALAVDGVTAIQFQVNANWSATPAPGPVSFDLYLDDIYFLPK